MNAVSHALNVAWGRLKSWVRSLNAALAVPPPLEGDSFEKWREDTVLQPRDF